MEDNQIVDLYWARCEDAIDETDKKYGNFCRRIAFNILYNEGDSRECVNDTYLKAWQSIPPHRPDPLSAFLGKITRNTALNRYKFNRAQLRAPSQMPLALEELRECIPDPKTTEQIIEDMALAKLLNDFLASLPEQTRVIFLQRYWYLCTVQQIAADQGVSVSKVKMTLLRTREKLRQLLEKEGFAL